MAPGCVLKLRRELKERALEGPASFGVPEATSHHPILLFQKGAVGFRQFVDSQLRIGMILNVAIDQTNGQMPASLIDLFFA